MKNKQRTIGILGGMGPQAGVALCNLLIEISARDFGAKKGDEFPEIIFNSIPVPDFFASMPNKEKALRILIQKVKQLNKLEINNFGIACNTAHLMLPELQQVSKIPFISMIDEVSLSVKKDGIKKVGLLASPAMLHSNLYQASLHKQSVDVVLPDEKDFPKIEATIGNVISGKLLQADTRKLIAIAQSLEKKGAQGIVLGCTELPLVFPKKFHLPVFNSLEILAVSLLRNYYK